MADSCRRRHGARRHHPDALLPSVLLRQRHRGGRLRAVVGNRGPAPVGQLVAAEPHGVAVRQLPGRGAWGIYSPFIWLIGLGSHVLFDAALYSTIVKLACLAIGSAGFYVLARSYGIPRAWSTAVAVAALLAGFTLYYDAPSWVNGLMAWCWWPLAVGLTRRSVLLNRTPYGGIAASLLLVGIGYVSTTLMLAASLAAILLEAVLRRDRGAIWRALAASTVAGLFTIVVHLPGLLTASVSGRNEGIVNTGFLGVDLSDLAIAGIPSGGPFMETYGSQFPGSPSPTSPGCCRWWCSSGRGSSAGCSAPARASWPSP
ncbi:hypothetical protein [Clavibacter tessellarius]|uniref:hypothetical protein n=1 Tax=Clavibacter tessellarius TaxID=31965 RepID=UPI0032475F93